MGLKVQRARLLAGGDDGQEAAFDCCDSPAGMTLVGTVDVRIGQRHADLRTVVRRMGASLPSVRGGANPAGRQGSSQEGEGRRGDGVGTGLPGGPGPVLTTAEASNPVAGSYGPRLRSSPNPPTETCK